MFHSAWWPRHVLLPGRLPGRPQRREDPSLLGPQVQAEAESQELGNLPTTHVRQLGTKVLIDKELFLIFVGYCSQSADKFILHHFVAGFYKPTVPICRITPFVSFLFSNKHAMISVWSLQWRHSTHRLLNLSPLG